jgi:predicted nucleotidyltransferase
MTAAVAVQVLRERLEDLSELVPDLELLILFGSAAKSRAGARSDLDLAVLCDGPADLDALYLVLTPRLRAGRLDLVDLRRTGSLLSFEVARSGVLLFERVPGRFRRFQSLASRRYADTRKLREAQRRVIHVFLQREGLA